jgi:hypothetical protein
VLGPLAVHLQSDRAPVRRFDDSPGYRGASTVGPVLITVHEGSLVCLLNELFHLLSVGSAMQGDPGTRHPHGNVAFRNARCARRSLLIPSLPPRPTIPSPQGRRAPPWGDCIRSRARGPGHRPLSARSVARIVVPSPPLAALGPSQGYQGRGRKPCAKRSHYCLQRCVYIQQ